MIAAAAAAIEMLTSTATCAWWDLDGAGARSVEPPTFRQEFARRCPVEWSGPRLQSWGGMNGTARTLVMALATTVTLSSSGCASRMADGGVIAAGGMLTIGGAVVGNRDASPTDYATNGPDFNVSQEFSVALVLLGVGLMAVGAIGLMHDPGDATEEGVIASHSPRGPMGAAAISESDRLGIRAAHAAQAGDCATVRLDVATMHAMDPEYASALVDHDPLIRGCMNG